MNRQSSVSDQFLQVGGKERMDSVDMALKSCPSTTEFVYIHDCARPLIKSTTIKQLKKEIISEGAVTVARPTTDISRAFLDMTRVNPKTHILPQTLTEMNYGLWKLLNVQRKIG